MIKKVFNVFTTVLLIFLIGVVILVFITRITGNTPSFFGYHIFRVTSGSMEPKLMIGDVILVKEVPSDEIHAGDIVTYNGKEGDMAGKIITHEVVEEPYEENGITYIQTQGITKGALKDPLIDYSQVEGKYVTTLGFLNAMYTFFLSPYGLIAFVGLIVVLFGYEAVSLVLSYKSMEEVSLDENGNIIEKKGKSKNTKV